MSSLMGPTVTPMVERPYTAPSFMRAATMLCRVSDGMAKPMPSMFEKLETIFMSMTCPLSLNSGPPELPSLMEVSVCKSFMTAPL